MNATQPSGGFVKKVSTAIPISDEPLVPNSHIPNQDLLTRRWCQVSEKEARDKVGQALRDAIKNLRANSQKKNGRAQSITPVKEPHSRKRARVDQKPDYQSSSEMLQPRNQAHHLDQLIQIPPSVFKTQLDASNPGSLASSASRYSSRDPLPVGSMIESTFQPFDSGAPRLPAQVTKRYSLSLCPYDVAEAGGHSQSDWEIMRAQWAQMPTTNLRASLGLSSAQQSYSIGGSTFTSTNAFSLEKLNEGTNLSTRLFASQEANGALSAVPVDPMFADAQTAQMGITSNDGQGWDVFEPTPMSSLDAAAAFDYLSVNREAL